MNNLREITFGVTVEAAQENRYLLHQAVTALFNREGKRDYIFGLASSGDADTSTPSLVVRSPYFPSSLAHLSTPVFTVSQGDNITFSILTIPHAGARERRRPLLDPDQRIAWMSQKLSKAGLETDSCFIEKQRIAPFRKAGSSFSLHETRFSGNATVTDPTAFLAAFTNGIGPGKAFGYGLIEFSRQQSQQRGN